jgi:hypothetical protein
VQGQNAGEAAARWLWAHRLAPGTPVWMLTGWAHEIGSGDQRRRLVEGVLAKPIDLEELRELLAEPAAARVTH